MRFMFLAAVGASLAATPALSQSAALDDPTIVAIFDAANTFDVETGQLALKKSGDKAVRDLAQQFINDHKSVRQQGRDLAKKLSVTPTPPKPFALAEAHAKAMAELRSKSGAEFDKAYVAHEVNFHQAVLDAVQSTLLPAIKNAELRAFVGGGRAAPEAAYGLSASKRAVKCRSMGACSANRYPDTAERRFQISRMASIT
jgi:putative membrane protein